MTREFIPNFILLIGFFFFSWSSSGITIQEKDYTQQDILDHLSIPDTLQKKTTSYCYKKFYQNSDNYVKSEIYALAYLKKTVEQNNPIKKANAYFMLNRITKSEILRVRYLDQCIILTQNLGHQTFPALAILEKGNLFFEKGKYKKALDYFLKSLDFASENNTKMSYEIKFNIALLKSRIGKYNEALMIFQDYHSHKLKDSLNYKSDDHIGVLFAMSDAYTKLKLLDSATLINKNGIQLSQLHSENAVIPYFTMNEGVNLFFKKNYNRAKDSLTKALPAIIEEKDHANMIYLNHYLGRSLWELGNKELAVKKFILVDSLFQENPDFDLDVRRGYKLIIKYYKEKNNLNKELEYLKKLIYIDSILSSDYRYINENITNNFDTTNLISEKERVIKKLSKTNDKRLFTIIGISMFLIIIVILLLRNILIKRRYKADFLKLLDRYEIENKDLQGNESKKSISITNVSKEVLENIEKGVEEFKKKKGYLKKGITSREMAKNINSNAKYLSLYIKKKENKSFIDFINTLRIEFVIDKLENETLIREYKIKAISEIAGFSNPITFSQAFQKKTSYKPSEFIKELKKNKI